MPASVSILSAIGRGLDNPTAPTVRSGDSLVSVKGQRFHPGMADWGIQNLGACGPGPWTLREVLLGGRVDWQAGQSVTPVPIRQGFAHSPALPLINKLLNWFEVDIDDDSCPVDASNVAASVACPSGKSA